MYKYVFNLRLSPSFALLIRLFHHDLDETRSSQSSSVNHRYVDDHDKNLSIDETAFIMAALSRVRLASSLIVRAYRSHLENEFPWLSFIFLFLSRFLSLLSFSRSTYPLLFLSLSHVCSVSFVPAISPPLSRSLARP